MFHYRASRAAEGVRAHGRPWPRPITHREIAVEGARSKQGAGRAARHRRGDSVGGPNRNSRLGAVVAADRA
jgi:hypothetical protein